MSTKRRSEDDDLADSDDDDDDFEEEEAPKPPKKKKRKKLASMIDDAAEESGSDDDGDDDDDDDEDEDEDNNEYVKDGFVVDEEEDEEKKKEKGDLEDSDDDDDDDEDDGSSDGSDEDDDDDGKKRLRKKGRRLNKIRKMRAVERLDDDDLALIQEAQGDDPDAIRLRREAEEAEEEERKQRARLKPVVASSEAELRKQLFDDDAVEEQQQQQQQEQVRKRQVVERYDEEDMDGFIEDDIGDQGEIMASERRGAGGAGEDQELNEAQLNEASEIFGTDYLEFMQDDDEDVDDEEEELLGSKSKYRERGVGIDYGVESDEEDLSDEDDDLFGEDDEDEDEDGTDRAQKAEALRLKREKRKLARAERRRKSLLLKQQRRKAQLRRAFEPVQLIENFCTDRDDLIRTTDRPERYFDWKTPFYGSDMKDGMTTKEEHQALWIANQIPEIASQISEGSFHDAAQSIANVLRFAHRDNLEPAFIARYRKDYITFPAVLKNLYDVLDQDGEWDRIVQAKAKVEALLKQLAAADASLANAEDAVDLQPLQEELEKVQAQLDESAKQELVVKTDLEALGGNDDGDDEDDDDDELFGGGLGDDKSEVRIMMMCFGLYWPFVVHHPPHYSKSYEPVYVTGKEKRKDAIEISLGDASVVVGGAWRKGSGATGEAAGRGGPKSRDGRPRTRRTRPEENQPRCNLESIRLRGVLGVVDGSSEHTGS